MLLPGCGFPTCGLSDGKRRGSDETVALGGVNRLRMVESRLAPTLESPRVARLSLGGGWCSTGSRRRALWDARRGVECTVRSAALEARPAVRFGRRSLGWRARRRPRALPQSLGRARERVSPPRRASPCPARRRAHPVGSRTPAGTRRSLHRLHRGGTVSQEALSGGAWALGGPLQADPAEVQPGCNGRCRQGWFS